MPTNTPALHFDGHPRYLGALPPRPVQPLPRFAAARVVLPSTQWQEIDLSAFGAPILDQDGQNSCVGHGAATAATIAWLQKGEALIRFAPGFIYAQINNNRDEGAVVADAMTELLSTGVCTEQEVPEGIIYQQQIPRSAYTTAARYKLAVAYHCGSWEEVCTALSLGYPVVGGWLLGQNFMNPGPSAVAPVPDRVVGGHCLCLVGLRRINEAWLCKLQNSWGQRWGQGGWGFMGQDFFNYTARQYGQVDCFAVQAMAEDPQEQPGPVAA